MKSRNPDVFGSFDIKIKQLRNNIQKLNLFDDAFGLEENIEKRKDAPELLKNLNWRSIIFFLKRLVSDG